MWQGISLKSERKNPWFRLLSNVLLHTRYSIRSMFRVLDIYNFGRCKQTFCFQFYKADTKQNMFFFQFSKKLHELAQKLKFLHTRCMWKWFHETGVRGPYLLSLLTCFYQTFHKKVVSTPSVFWFNLGCTVHDYHLFSCLYNQNWLDKVLECIVPILTLASCNVVFALSYNAEWLVVIVFIILV